MKQTTTKPKGTSVLLEGREKQIISVLVALLRIPSVLSYLSTETSLDFHIHKLHKLEKQDHHPKPSLNGPK